MENKKYDTLEIENGTYETTLTKKYQMREAWVPDNPKEVKTFIPGTIVEIRVKEGQQVKEGDILIVYKAMKMHNNIRAKFDGTIKKIVRQVGENLPNHTVMLEFE